MTDSRATQARRSSRRILVPAALAVALVNLLGGLAAFLFFSINPPAIEPPPQLNYPSTWISYALIPAVCVAVAILFTGRSNRRIASWCARIGAGYSTSEVPPLVKRDVLRSTITVSAVVAMQWLLIGTIVGITAHSWRIFVGLTVIGGVLSAALTFLVHEVLWRPVVLQFFPDGDLEAPGAWRLPVLGRLLIAFILVGVYPPVVIVILTGDRARQLMTAGDPAVIFGNLMFSLGSLLAATVLASLALAVFTTRSIVDPLDRLRQAMERVADNDLSVSVPVSSNDEIGYLSGRFNRMTADLRRTDRLQKLLNLYVSPEVAREAMRSGAPLGGQLTECSILFADIRDFTALAERLEPDALITLLNRYFRMMIHLVVENGGIVNKLIGDAILAVFGTPLNPATDHAARAVRSALEMQRALVAFNTEQRASGGRVIEIGAGIATGTVVAGNVGGEQRLEYTVMGDPVNLASRLQGMTRELGARILLSEATYRQARPSLELTVRPPTQVSVKGKARLVTVYSLDPDTGASE